MHLNVEKPKSNLVVGIRRPGKIVVSRIVGFSVRIQSVANIAVPVEGSERRKDAFGAGRVIIHGTIVIHQYIPQPHAFSSAKTMIS